uniref:MOSC domain-containing protein n=1 Tax=Heterorhabditis bacteriophora TaxID=37862 RepID=A0A1I7X6S3_HETBA
MNNQPEIARQHGLQIKVKEEVPFRRCARIENAEQGAAVASDVTR